jgi:hypothetical protein
MPDIPNNFVAKTSIGSFNVKITNRDYISIGNNKPYCVQIKYDKNDNTATLDWLGTEKGGCEIDNKAIKGRNTITMVDLGFTILKQLYPAVNPNVKLIDSSTFKCDLPDNNKTSISNMIYNLLLSGQTYYQKQLNAQLRYEKSEEAYDAFVKNRVNPNMFDKNYNFKNDDLNTMLHPIMQVSDNWGEFFEKLYKKFGRQTCVLMHAWYLNVYGFLAQQAIHTEWSIDITNRPQIDYTITSRNNSKNYTIKSFAYNPYEFGGGGEEYIPSLISYKCIKPVRYSRFITTRKRIK